MLNKYLECRKYFEIFAQTNQGGGMKGGVIKHMITREHLKLAFQFLYNIKCTICCTVKSTYLSMYVFVGWNNSNFNQLLQTWMVIKGVKYTYWGSTP